MKLVVPTFILLTVRHYSLTATHTIINVLKIAVPPLLQLIVTSCLISILSRICVLFNILTYIRYRKVIVRVSSTRLIIISRELLYL